MPAPPANDQRGLNDILDDGADRYRIVALYTMDEERLSRFVDRDQSTADGGEGLPIAQLFDGSRFQQHYERRSSMFPISTACRPIEAEGLGLPTDVTDCRAIWTLLRFPSGHVLGAFGLSFRLALMNGSQRSTTLVSIRQRIDDERAAMHLGGFEQMMGPDFHQVLMVPDAHAAEFGDNPLMEDVQRLVATKTDDVRQGYQSARMPRDANRYLGAVAAVTPGASMLGGQDEHIQRACLVTAMQVMASLGSLRAIFFRAYEETAAFRRTLISPDAGQLDRRKATGIATGVRALQLDLSHEVECQQEVRLAVPLLPVEEFHAEVADALGMTSASRTTSRMVERLTAALDAELGRLRIEDAEESDHQSRRLEAWAIGLTVLAGVSVPITLILALLGSNVAEVLETGGRLPSIWEARFVPYYLALVIVPVAAGVGAWAVSRRILRVGD